MCQLTFINTGHKFSNQLFTANQALVNTLTEHKDGFGVFCNKKTYKTPKSPWEITNFSTFSNEIITASPVLLHVRKASYVYATQKKVDIEHTHPFETEHLILAHNGTLEPVTAFPDPEYKEMIDSQIFLSELEKEYVSNSFSLVPSLQNTMKKFTGKFAFLIYEKNSTLFYAARGEIATLHHFPIIIYDKNREVLSEGYILNTEKDSLLSGLVQFSNLLYVNKLSMNCSMPYKEITILPENSIFLLGDKIENIGKIEENKKVYYAGTASGNVYNYDDEYSETWWDQRQRNSVIINPPIGETPRTYCAKLTNYVGKWQVSIPYIDIISWRLYDKSLVCLNEDEFKYLLECLDYLDNFVTRGVIKYWNKIKKVNGYDLDFHSRFLELEFPYMLNPVESLEAACDIYEKERDQSRVSGL
jgi:predicted glutamine amidotransferase